MSNFNENNQKDILMSAGTSEFEIVEFLAGGNIYGINVAKVREVILKPETTSVPQAHPNIEGIFDLRGESVALVNLPRCLGITPQGELRNVIVSEINNRIIGFLIEKVLRIKRISWKALMQPPDMGANSYVNGVIHDGDKMTLLLDFEMLAAQITPHRVTDTPTVEAVSNKLIQRRSKVPVVFVEDSTMFRSLLHSALQDGGYTKLYEFTNGQEAWEYLNSVAQSSDKIQDDVQVIISDVEMPVMDGYSLLKKVKSDNRLKQIPVVLFSSLITEDIKDKGGQLGAAAVVRKSNFNELIESMDSLLWG